MKKVVLISGATSGIGKATVMQLLQAGFRVAAFSSDAKKTALLKRELSKQFKPKDYLVTTADVRNEGALKRVVKAARRQFKRIDILINNAGYGYFVSAEAVDGEAFRRMLEVNIVGMALLTKLVVPEMKRRKQGLIINTASISGRPPITPWSEFYAATKFAVMGMSDGLRTELRPFGVGVATICPGMVDTAFFTSEELARRKKLYNGKMPTFLQPEHVAEAIVFVCARPAGITVEDILIRAV